MGDVELQSLLSGIHSLLTDTRDRVIKVEGAIEGFSEFRVETRHQLERLRADVDALQSSDDATAAVKAYRDETRMTRIWTIGCVCSCVGTMIAMAAFVLLHA